MHSVFFHSCKSQDISILLDQLGLYRRMQGEYVISLLSKEGKQISMEVKQKNQHITKRKVKTWSTEEDNQLLELYQQYPKRWSDIAALMKDRNQNQCLHRYRRLSQLGKSHKIWSSQEDETVRKLIKKYGKNWKLLSEMLGSKNGKQIRERFINKLDPKIKKEEWTEEEDRKILELYSSIGSKWSEISKHLPGRPENKIKNRFYSYIQKNYEISFREIENIDPAAKPNKSQHKIGNNPQAKLTLQESIAQRSFQSVGLREEVKRQEDKLMSKFEIPSINEIEFEFKNDNLISQNFMEPVLRGQEDWKSNRDYQSIIELNSDIFFKYHL